MKRGCGPSPLSLEHPCGAGLWGCWAPSPGFGGTLSPSSDGCAVAGTAAASASAGGLRGFFCLICFPTQWEQAELDPCLLRAALASLPGSTEPSPGSGRGEELNPPQRLLLLKLKVRGTP